MIGNNIFKRNNRNPGFTLVEVLVTVSIFTVVLLVSTGVFININSLQQQSGNIQKLQNEGRYILERLAKEVRSRELDYAMMEFVDDSITERLIFKPDEFSEILEVYFQDNNLMFSITNALGETRQAPINSETEVAIESAKFYLTPIREPAELDPDNIVQPKTTIFLSLKNINGLTKYAKTLDLQTTISRKIYK